MRLIKAILLLFSFSISIAKCELSGALTYLPTVGNWYGFDCSTDFKHLTVLVSDSGVTYIKNTQLDIDSSTSTVQDTILKLNGSFSQLAQSRTSSLNTNTSATGTYLFFTTASVYKFNNSFNTQTLLNSVSANTTKIVDVFYLTDSITYYYMIRNQNGLFRLCYFHDTSEMACKNLSMLESGTQYVQKVQNNNRIFLLFKCGTYIFTQNSSMTLVTTFSFDSNSSKKAIDSYSYFFAKSQGPTVYVINITNISFSFQIKNLTYTTQIDDIKIRFPYLFVWTNSRVVQYDLQAQSKIGSRNLGLSTYSQWRMGVLVSNYIFVYQLFSSLYGTLYQVQYNSSATYDPNVGCLQGYYYDVTVNRCMKNASYVYTVVVPTQTTTTTTTTNTTDNSTNTTNDTTTNDTSNTTDATTNTTATDNSTSTTNTTNTTSNSTGTTNTTPTPTPTPTPPTPSTPNSSTTPTPTNPSTPSSSSPSTQDYSKISIDIGKVLTFSSICLMPASIQCLALMLDDMWYYQYHRINYPYYAQLFMNNINIINQFRLKPWFVDQWDVVDQIQIDFQQNKSEEYQMQISENQKNPSTIYFAENSEDIYIQNWIMNFGFFVAVRVLGVCFDYLPWRGKKIRKIKNWLHNNSKWWTLFTSCLETNMMRLTFNTFLQFLSFASFNFTDKMNMIGCISVLALVVFYALAFYPLVFSYDEKRASKTLLAYSKYHEKSFIFQSLCFMVRCVVRGCVQSLFMQNYGLQIIGLASIDLIFTVLCFIFYYQFYNKTTFLFIVLYNFCFLLFDTTLIFHDRKIQWFSHIDYNYLLLFLILGIGLMYILSFGSLLVLDIYEALCKPKKKQKKDETREAENFADLNQIQDRVLVKFSSKKFISNKSCGFPSVPSINNTITQVQIPVTLNPKKNHLQNTQSMKTCHNLQQSKQNTQKSIFSSKNIALTKKRIRAEKFVKSFQNFPEGE